MRDQSYGEDAPHLDADTTTTRYWERADDEWAERMLAEGTRSARMLGTVLVALVILAVLVAVALAWPIGGE